MTMAKTERSRTRRKTLKSTLANVLQRGWSQGISSELSLGSGILRPVSSTASLATSSIAPGNASTWSLSTCDRLAPTLYRSQNAGVYRPESDNRSPRYHRPATSMSQLNLQDASYHHYLRQTNYRPTPATGRHAVSQQASGTSLVSSQFRSTSTLRLQSSQQTLTSATTQTTIPPSLDHHSPKHGRYVIRGHDFSSRSPSPTDDIPVALQSSTSLPVESEIADGIASITHFSTFCVLDTSSEGCPVIATSQDLRHVLDLGESFCLNNQTVDGTSMDIITGVDSNGASVTHLVLFSPLIIPSSGRSRFMLASLVDVTDFIHSAAAVPDLDETSISTLSGQEVQTPRFAPPPCAWYESSSELSVDDFLGGCCLSDIPSTVCTPPRQHIEEDVWVDIATEERKRQKADVSANVSQLSSRSSQSSRIDDVLDRFISALQELYSDFFLLGASALDEDYYEICNVSPRVYALREFVDGHLSRTSEQGMLTLTQELTGGRSFSMLVRWGVQGQEKRLYCVPLYARHSTTWVCFLVPPGLSLLW